MLLNVIDGVGDPDPVFTLQDRYDVWRAREIDALTQDEQDRDQEEEEA